MLVALAMAGRTLARIPRPRWEGARIRTLMVVGLPLLAGGILLTMLVTVDVAAPTLVIAGERDNVYGQELLKATAHGVRDGRLIVYPGASHASTMTHKPLGDDIADFLLAPDHTRNGYRPNGMPALPHPQAQHCRSSPPHRGVLEW